MRATIYNRSGELPNDNWYQIEVTGEHPASGGRVQVIDEIAVKAMVEQFNRTVTATGLLVDADHLSHELDQQTAAYGWMKEARVNSNGQMEGRIEWTDLGDTAVTNKRYQFFSTEYQPADLEKLGDKRVRPLALSGLALTNRPNNRGGRPITNKSPQSALAEDKENDSMKAIAKKLGLPEDASESDICEAIAKLKTKGESQKEEIENRDKELKELRNRDADAALEKHAGKIGNDDASKEFWKEQLITNRAKAERALEKMPNAQGVQGEKKPNATPLHNRRTAGVPDASLSADDSKEELEAKRISNRATELSKQNPNRSWNECWDQAESEVATQ